MNIRSNPDNTRPAVTTGDEVQSLAVENFHLQNLILAGESIDTVPGGQRDVSCLVLGLSRKGFESCKAEIQSLRKRLPISSAIAASKHAQLRIGRAAKFRAFERHDVNRVALARMNRERKTKIRGQPGGDFFPAFARVFSAPVLQKVISRRILAMS